MTTQQKQVFDDLMSLYEFSVYENENGKLQVSDLQYACLGDICSEEFDDEFDILERMEIYHEDYIIRGLEETFDFSFDTYGEWLEFLKTQDHEEYGYDIAVLSLITKSQF